MGRINGRPQHDLGSSRDEHVDIRTDQFGCLCGNIGTWLIDIPIFNGQILALDVAELLQFAGES